VLVIHFTLFVFATVAIVKKDPLAVVAISCLSKHHQNNAKILSVKGHRKFSNDVIGRKVQKVSYCLL